MDRETAIKKIRKILKNTHRPLILFDSDSDGLTSFLMTYNFIGDGKGVYVKENSLDADSNHITAINNYSPDRVIILDVPKVTDDFLAKIKIPVLRIDHHPTQESKKKIDYFNPLIFDQKDNRPVSYWVYKILNNEKYLWLAMVGNIADWQITDLKEKFIEKYPKLLDKKVTSPPQALFDSKVGKMSMILDFCLKGTGKQIKTNIKVLTRIQEPDELLDEKTPKGKFIMKHYKKINSKYQEILKSINTKDKKLIAYLYKDSGVAVSSILSNELQYRNPKKFIIVARENKGNMFSSLRSQIHNVQELMQKLISEFPGATGGGHIHACGASIPTTDYNDFVARLKEEMDDFKE